MATTTIMQSVQTAQHDLLNAPLAHLPVILQMVVVAINIMVLGFLLTALYHLWKIR